VIWTKFVLFICKSAVCCTAGVFTAPTQTIQESFESTIVPGKGYIFFLSLQILQWYLNWELVSAVKFILASIILPTKEMNFVYSGFFFKDWHVSI
jgi:ABC-type uncharacterized transport system permease subunit